MAYRETYSFAIEGSLDPRIGTLVFDSKKASEDAEEDQYSNCRAKVQAWLDKHFPGEKLATTGNDIMRDGSTAENEEEIDMTRTPRKRQAEEEKHADASPEKKTKKQQVYDVQKQRLVDLGGPLGEDECVLLQLTNHLSMRDDNVVWPDTFRVVIQTMTGDDDGLTYYKEGEDQPFLHMDWNDDAFYIAAALLRAVGTLVVE